MKGFTKGWIEVDVQCHTEESSKLEELDLPISEDDFQFRNTDLQICNITALDDANELGGKAYIYFGVERILVKQTREELRELIKNNV